MAKPVFKDNNKLDLIFDFAFHQKRVNDSKNKQIITAIIHDLTDQNYQIECHLNSSRPPSPDFNFNPDKKTKLPNKDLAKISKIFGGGELIDKL